jgi:hypothetical protein
MKRSGSRVTIVLVAGSLLHACAGGSRSTVDAGGPGPGQGGGGAGGSTGAGGSSAAGGSSGGRGGAAGGDGQGGGAGGSLQNPNPTGLCPPDSATCTEAQWNAYTACIADACDSQYQVCLGPSYRAGTYGGPCGPWAQCLAGCGCGNAGCRANCPVQTAACATCYANVSSCLVTCSIPTCALTPPADAGAPRDAAPAGDAGAGAGCAALLACCNGMSDPSSRDDCLNVYGTISAMGDRQCMMIHDEYQSLGFCP